MKYQTKQKEALLFFLQQQQDKQLSIEEIGTQMKEKLGKSTLYRLMNQLVEQEQVLRFRGQGQKTVRYQLVNREDGCNQHFHMQCNACGTLFHLHCNYLSDLDSHIGHHHQFSIDPTQTIFYGVCNQCKGREQS